MVDRFAAHGQGASKDDLNQFIKLSDSMATLLANAALGPAQQLIVDKDDGADANGKYLENLLSKLMKNHAADEAAGIFRDQQGRIVEPGSVEYGLLKARYELDQRIERARAGIIDAEPVIEATPERSATPPPAPPREAEPVAAAPAASSAPNVVKLHPEPQATPAPAPLTAEEQHRRTCAENDRLFRQYDAVHGGSFGSTGIIRGDAWSPPGSWTRGW